MATTASHEMEVRREQQGRGGEGSAAVLSLLSLTLGAPAGPAPTPRAAPPRCPTVPCVPARAVWRQTKRCAVRPASVAWRGLAE